MNIRENQSWENLKQEILNSLEKSRAQAFEEAAYVAEMKSINEAGHEHVCSDYGDSCKWLGEVANELRARAHCARQMIKPPPFPQAATLDNLLEAEEEK